VKPGICIIDATQAGNASYLAAARVQMRIRVISGAHIQAIIYFGNNSVALTAAAKKQLASVARLTLVDGLTKLAITGYASSTGSVAGNKALGNRRAIAAEKYLATLLSRLHVKGVHFTVAGKGASAFAVKNSKSGLNRRDVIQGS
jgi:outer membrane protein OmpA-like peptidoglycan-associated protein